MPQHRSIAGPVNTICGGAISNGPGRAHAATIKAGKTGQPHTAQTHYTTTPPQTTLKRRAQHVALAAVSHNTTQRQKPAKRLCGQGKKITAPE
jgi:hypothetical protein